MTDDISKKTENSAPQIEGVGITHSKLKRPTKNKTKKLLIVVPVLILGLLAGSILTMYLMNRPTCSNELLQIAGSSIQGTRKAQLSNLAKDIKTKPGYDRDANCLYVVLKDSINNSDSSAAIKAYDSLIKVYDKDTGFSSALGNDLDSIEDLKRQVEFLQKFEENITSNFSGVKEP